ncbi:MAG: DUF389 domain-containing protein [Spirulinaceae cyanobacterium]
MGPLQLSRLAKLNQYLPKPPNREQVTSLENELFVDAELSVNYSVLILSSCAIATFGLISNSTAVIIGAMLIAPLMLPLRGLAFAALEGNVNLFRKSTVAIAFGTVVAILLSCFLGILVNLPEFGSEFLARVRPNLVDLGIAVTAGAISGFAKVRKGISDALAGTAIAVALMPPLCVVGLSLAKQLWGYSSGAFLLYLTNLLGITLACMTVFIIAGYAKATRSLGVAMALTSLLFLPLGSNFVQLLREAQLQQQQRELENAIAHILERQTITVGQNTQLLQTQINWKTNPPQVFLVLAAQKEITPKQVQDVEAFIARRLNQSMRLYIYVNQVKVVHADSESTSNAELELFREQFRSTPHVDPFDLLQANPPTPTEDIETIEPLPSFDKPPKE